jgi:hypothetical protein
LCRAMASEVYVRMATFAFFSETNSAFEVQP